MRGETLVDMNAPAVGQLAWDKKSRKRGVDFIVFMATLDLTPKFLSFSQKRYVGFRKQFEFKNRRILVANETQIKIIGYSVNEGDLPFEIINYSVPEGKITYASFLEDINPNKLLIVTYDPALNRSIIHLIKLSKKANLLSYTFQEEEEKSALINNVVRGFNGTRIAKARP
jgi:hypothetical protein